MADATRQTPSPWARRGLVVAVIVAALIDLNRFSVPVSEHVIRPMSPGSADFVYGYMSSRAFVLGYDPYHHEVPALQDPWGRKGWIEGRPTSQYYLPTHVLLFVPFALVFKGNVVLAARVYFGLNLVLLGVIAAALRRLFASLERGDGERRAPSWPLLFLALALNHGAQLGLERGQSDIVGAALCWVGALFFLRRRIVLALILVLGATLLKGYGGLFLVGLMAIAFAAGRRGTILAALGLGAFGLLGPVVGHLGEGLQAVWVRFGAGDGSPINHAFAHLAKFFGPPALHGSLRGLFSGAAFGAAGLTLALTVRAVRRPGRAPDEAAWLVAFATASFVAFTTLAATAFSYTLLFSLPGVLLLTLGQATFVRAARIGPRGELASGVTLAAANALLAVGRIPGTTFPPAAMGLLLVVVWLIVVSARALRNPAPDARRVAA